MDSPSHLNSSTPAWAAAVQAQADGDLARAAALFLACPADALRGSGPALFSAAWCLELAQRIDEAARLYGQTIAQTTEPALLIEAHFRLGWIALQAGEVARAEEQFGHATDLAAVSGATSPTIAHAKYWRAVCLETEGRLLDAATAYQPIVDEGSPDLWHEAAYRRLLCLVQVGALDQALVAAQALLSAERGAADRGRLQELQALAGEEKAQILRARAAA